MKGIASDIMDRRYTRLIIEAARQPKSVPEINHECQIPLSTAYRRVAELCNYGFLTIYSSAIRDGRRSLLYKTKETFKNEGLSGCPTKG